MTSAPMSSSIRSFALLALAAPLAAQDQSRDTARVDPVVVSATRAALTQGALPVAVTVITGEELRLRGVTSVSDALRDVTSAYVAQAGSHGATTSLFLRGGESKYVKVLVDGVPTNDPGGTYDFAALTTDNVERIEIVRGPASVIHGADAVTGVVHVITRRGLGPQEASVDVRMGLAPRDAIAVPGGRDPGSVRTADLTVATAGATPAGAYSLALARHGSSGLYDLNNDFTNNVLSGRFSFAAGQGTDVRLSLRYTDYRFHYPTDGGGTPVDTNAFRTEDRIVIGAEVDRRVRDALRLVLALSSSVNDGGTDDAMDGPGGSSFVSQDKTRRRGAELRAHVLASAAAAITAGAQVEQQDQRSQFQSESAFGPFTSRFSAARRNLGAYVEGVFTPADRLTATLGARVDDNQQFGTFGTGRGGLSFRPVRATRLRATVGNAFREPSFFENFATGFVSGNPGLRPERTLSVDGGVDQELAGGRAELSLTAFAQRFRDMIDYTGSTAACGFSYCNVAEATSRGVELEVGARLVRGLRGTLGATLLRTEVVEPGFDTSSAGLYRPGESLIRRPERTVNAGLTYRGTGPLSAAARLLAVGTRHDRDFTAFPATPVVLPSYERLDLSAEYRVRIGGLRHSGVTLRLENVTDARYRHVYNFLTPRRTVSVGMSASW